MFINLIFLKCGLEPKGRIATEKTPTPVTEIAISETCLIVLRTPTPGFEPGNLAEADFESAAVPDCATSAISLRLPGFEPGSQALSDDIIVGSSDLNRWTTAAYSREQSRGFNS